MGLMYQTLKQFLCPTVLCHEKEVQNGNGLLFQEQAINLSSFTKKEVKTSCFDFFPKYCAHKHNSCAEEPRFKGIRQKQKLCS